MAAHTSESSKTPGLMSMTAIERIRRRIEVSEQGCWVWLGAKGPKGYGRIPIGNRTLTAHRVSYEAFIGTIPQDLQIDHLCRNRSCVNPDHLEAVTAEENNRRKVAAHTHCKRGHEMNDANTRIYRGVRVCKTCTKMHSDIRNAKVSAELRARKSVDN